MENTMVRAQIDAALKRFGNTPEDAFEGMKAAGLLEGARYVSNTDCPIARALKASGMEVGRTDDSFMVASGGTVVHQQRYERQSYDGAFQRELAHYLNYYLNCSLPPAESKRFYMMAWAHNV